MLTAKEAYAKTMSLIKKDEDALIAKCEDFIESTVCPKVCLAIEDRQLYCGVDVPGGLKSATDIIQQKLIDLGYTCKVNPGYTNSLSIGWRD